MSDKEKLSAGLCDTCSKVQVITCGNGYEEPQYEEYICSVFNTEVIPYPISHKAERVEECTGYEKMEGINE